MGSPKVAICRISQKIPVTIRHITKFIAQHSHKLKSCINDTKACGGRIDWRVIGVVKLEDQENALFDSQYTHCGRMVASSKLEENKLNQLEL